MPNQSQYNITEIDTLDMSDKNSYTMLEAHFRYQHETLLCA